MRIESFLQQSPIFQASRIARGMDASLNLLLEAEGLTPLESLVLASIFFEKRAGVQPSALAKSFQTTRGNVSHCVSSLEAKGFVQRRVDPEDARAFRIMLKPEGRRKAVRIVGIFDRLQRHLEKSLGVPFLQKAIEQMWQVESMCAEYAHYGQKAAAAASEGRAATRE